jgi:hypothetical protein
MVVCCRTPPALARKRRRPPSTKNPLPIQAFFGSASAETHHRSGPSTTRNGLERRGQIEACGLEFLFDGAASAASAARYAAVDLVIDRQQFEGRSFRLR